jgi:TatD DNase family protein
MNPPLSLDMHAHVDPEIAAADLLDLRAAVFAATRSLDEAELAIERQDERTAWGVGCHPGLARAQKSFDIEHFTTLILKTAYVAEVGLDGRSRVPLDTQIEILNCELRTLQAVPRITSLHSYRATEQLVLALEHQPIAGAVLHWWLGDEQQTRRALEVGCYFSVNASSVRRADLLEVIPLDRLLTETDHPFGDRQSSGARRPGAVADVEAVLAQHHGLMTEQVRSVMWENFRRLAGAADCVGLLPRGIRVQLTASL